MLRTCPVAHLSVCECVCVSISLSVRLSGKCTGTKRLIGSRCHLGWSNDGWVYYRWRWWSLKGKWQFWGEFGASHCNHFSNHPKNECVLWTILTCICSWKKMLRENRTVVSCLLWLSANFAHFLIQKCFSILNTFTVRLQINHSQHCN